MTNITYNVNIDIHSDINIIKTMLTTCYVSLLLNLLTDESS
jgi:hypothetical protein